MGIKRFLIVVVLSSEIFAAPGGPQRHTDLFPIPGYSPLWRIEDFEHYSGDDIDYQVQEIHRGGPLLAAAIRRSLLSKYAVDSEKHALLLRTIRVFNDRRLGLTPQTRGKLIQLLLGRGATVVGDVESLERYEIVEALVEAAYVSLPTSEMIQFMAKAEQADQVTPREVRYLEPRSWLRSQDPDFSGFYESGYYVHNLIVRYLGRSGPHLNLLSLYKEGTPSEAAAAAALLCYSAKGFLYLWREPRFPGDDIRALEGFQYAHEIGRFERRELPGSPRDTRGLPRVNRVTLPFANPAKPNPFVDWGTAVLLNDEEEKEAVALTKSPWLERQQVGIKLLSRTSLRPLSVAALMDLLGPQNITLLRDAAKDALLSPVAYALGGENALLACGNLVEAIAGMMRVYYQKK